MQLPVWRSSDEATTLVFEDEDNIIWVDWREEDEAIVRYVADVINGFAIKVDWEGDDMIIAESERRETVPLKLDCGDRHVALCAINKFLAGSHEVRFVKASDGSDTLAFAVLPREAWAALEDEFGAKVQAAFEVLVPEKNVFG